MSNKILIFTSNKAKLNTFVRNFSLENKKFAKDHYKLLVVGGGAGGIATGSSFARKIGAENVAIVDPAKNHYYQPGWTLVGGGIEKAEKMCRPQIDQIPKNVDFFQVKASDFDPDQNSVGLADGQKIKYDYLVMATGIYINFDGIKGLTEALQNDDKVCSIYSPDYVKKVFPAIQNFKEGNAIFTFPKMPIKCPGAPQKIMYLAEEYFREHGNRDKAHVIYNTFLPVIFGVKKYADSLMEVVKKRNIEVNFRTELVEVDYKNNLAIFEKLDTPGTFVKFNYSLLHVSPPMKAYDEIAKSKLADSSGFVEINKETMQHMKYPNVFGIGDCTTMPSKTAAAVAAESNVLIENLGKVMDGHELSAKYDGYTSCPLITGKGKLILAEFDGNSGTPMETFPYDQSKESRFAYFLKKDAMPLLYWNGILKGVWPGPKLFRSIFRKIFFFKY